MVLIKYSLLFNLKYSFFCLSAKVESMSNDLVHAMPWECKVGFVEHVSQTQVAQKSGPK